MANVDMATTYLLKTIYSGKWAEVSPETKEQALFTAKDQFSSLGLNWEVEQVEEALFLQTFFLTQDLDRVDYQKAEANGISSFDGITMGGKKSILYPEVEVKIKQYKKKKWGYKV